MQRLAEYASTRISMRMRAMAGEHTTVDLTVGAPVGGGNFGTISWSGVGRCAAVRGMCRCLAGGGGYGVGVLA